MKTRKLIRKFYQAIITHDAAGEKKIWFKLLKKSLKHKHTEAIK